jgi:hypothetical protein
MSTILQVPVANIVKKICSLNKDFYWYIWYLSIYTMWEEIITPETHHAG